MANATSAAAFIGTLGINTHIDFNAYGYQNLTTVESNINYLGMKIIRDSAETAGDAQSWLQVAQATGAKFDDYIAETSPSGLQTDLSYVKQLAQEGILSAIEGGDEEDDSYPESLGNTPQITAQFQQQVYALGQQLGLPVINLSFGAGWTAANNWDGDYGTVGDLSSITNYSNAHTYPNAGQLPDATIERMNGLAQMAASTRPVMTTEIGWDDTVFTQATIAKYVLDSAMDGIKDGDAGMYYYGLYDDASGDWGLFNADGTPRPAATALHNLTTLLTDTGSNAATFTPGSLNYTLSGTQSGDSSVLIEKSDGSFWLSLWNETEAANMPHTITVNLGGQAASVIEFDPLTGTSSIATWSNVSSVQVSVPDHPVLLEIVPAAGSTSTSTTTTTTTTTTPTGPAVNLPGSESVTAGAVVTVSGLSITDTYAAANPGSLALNLSTSTGLIAMTGTGGTAIAGSGTHAISVTGTLAQLNADLATLTYTAGSSAGGDAISVDVWDQAGLEGNKSLEVTIGAAGSTTTTSTSGTSKSGTSTSGTSTTTTTPTAPVINLPATDNVTTGSTTTVSSVSITDAFAASNPGSMVLTVTDTTGLIAMTGAGGTALAGSGTHAISVSGSLSQLNADLATLSYAAGSSTGSDAISVDVWDQAGLEGTKSTAITVSAPVVTTVTATGPAVTVPAVASVTAGAILKVSGVAITDAFAAANPGSLVLNLSATTGLISLTNASGTAIAGSGTHALTVSGTLAQLNADLATMSYIAGSAAGTDAITVDVWDQAGLEGTKSAAVTVAAPAPSGPAIALPLAKSLAAGATAAINGMSVSDASAGTVVLDLSAGNGTLSMTNVTGTAIAGSGTHLISLSGTVAQIDADLAHLSYTASGGGSDGIVADVSDAAGHEASATLKVTATGTTASAMTQVVNVAATTASDTVSASSIAIHATAGNHSFLITGSNDTLTATGGNETVSAIKHNVTITTGAGSDSITLSGSGHVVNAGGGENTIQDYGTGNTFVLPAPSQGYDTISGTVLTNGDLLDFRSLLAATSWNGQTPVGSYLSANTVGNNTVISVSPTGAGGTGVAVATLNGTGSVGLSGILAHAIL